MKKIVVILFLLAIGLIGYSQPDPAVAIILKQIEVLQAKNLALQASIEAKTNAMLAKQVGATTLDVIQGLQSLEKINQILQSLYCQTSQTSYLISISGSNCLLDMDVNLALLNVTYSQDILRTVFMLTSTYFLYEESGGTRLDQLKNLADAMDRSIRIFRKLNSNLSLRLEKGLVQDLLIREEKRIISGSYGVNRYTSN